MNGAILLVPCPCLRADAIGAAGGGDGDSDGDNYAEDSSDPGMGRGLWGGSSGDFEVCCDAYCTLPFL